MVGESSVFYLFSKQAAAEIAHYNPDAKIIIMLREPVAFLYSLHSQGLYSGNETETDFAKALALEAVRRQGEQLPSTVHFPSRLYYREHLQIAEQIERYLEHFPKEQIKIILFDDFKRHTERVVRDVLTFLDLDVAHMPNLVNHNQNTRMRSQRLARIIQDPEHPITSTAKRLLPRRVWKKGKVLLKKVNTDHSPRVSINQELELNLREVCTPSIDELNTLLLREGWLENTSLHLLWGYN